LLSKSRAFRMDGRVAPVKRNINRPILVRPEHPDAPRPKSFDGRGRRMAVRVAQAHRDQPDPRSDRVEERRGRGGPAAVMGDLQDLDRREAARKQHRVDLFLDVSGEEESLAPEGTEQDDRHVVDGGSAIGRLDGHRAPVRPHDAEGDAVEREAVAGGEAAGAGSKAPELPLPCPIAGPRTDHPRLQDSANPVSREEKWQSPNVILVRMGEDDQVQAAVPWRYVGVELDEEPIRVRPSVDEHAPSAVTLDKDGVSLPDVENGQVDGPVRAAGHDEDERGDRRSQAAAKQPRRPG
jgi:hypothetical protein